MLKRILLIGGGEIAEGETINLDRKFIKLAGGSNAVIGFFPTAANDSQGYIDTFNNYYLSLDCKEVIPVKLGTTSGDTLRKLLKKMTGIYLGGGNTSLLVSTIKKRGVDKLLKEALARGVAIAGMSAGALVTCDFYIDPEDSDKALKTNKGLGLQNSVICIVHYDEKRDQVAMEYLKKSYPNYKIVGIEEGQGIYA